MDKWPFSSSRYFPVDDERIGRRQGKVTTNNYLDFILFFQLIDSLRLNLRKCLKKLNI